MHSYTVTGAGHVEEFDAHDEAEACEMFIGFLAALECGEAADEWREDVVVEAKCTTRI